MNNDYRDNTKKLIYTGLLVVSLPTFVALFSPLALAALWVFGEGKFLLWPLFAGMLAGLVLSFFLYRFSSVRWLRWALNKSSNLPHLKRKAIKSGLVSEKGAAVFDHSFFLDKETLGAFNKIDHTKAQSGNSDVPQIIQLYSTTGNKTIGIIAILLFIIPAVILFIVLPREERWSVLKFSPLLLVGLFFLFRKNTKKLLLEIDGKGLRSGENEWNWSEIKSVRYMQRRSLTSSPGRNSFYSNSSQSLSFKTIDGASVSIPLDSVSINFDLEEYIAVYRNRSEDAG